MDSFERNYYGSLLDYSTPIHEGDHDDQHNTCEKKQTQIWSTVKTGIIKSCAMWLGIPYFRKGAKNTAKKRAAQPL